MTTRASVPAQRQGGSLAASLLAHSPNLQNTSDSSLARLQPQYSLRPPSLAFGAPVRHAMEKDEARLYLSSILNKNLRVLTTDGRLFWGSFKCTDPDKNIVLASTYEYRQPSSKQRSEAAEKAGNKNVTLDMTSRYLGLVVVPGEHIVRIEVEEFASQQRNQIFI
ncbi:hypothetical protein AK830_g9204 [Neonectria ditissima]|uniref:Sm domain-containing protein n=1 Tax=Neonectria ditissima TaxID=78410 RepID=A0A0P7BAC2_9HYPO|nr:hypothetical protein AK830_g9204 [Neonectria ditissima]